MEKKSKEIQLNNRLIWITWRIIMELHKGQILENKYEILEKIGVGGFSTVYKALQININRLVALKVFSRYNCINNEINVLKNIKHDFLPQLFDVINSEYGQIIVMEYIDGINLMEYINEYKEIDTFNVIRYINQLCDVIGYIHRHNPPILHCDIKPNNILLTKSNNICLIDFNLSRIRDFGMNVLGRTDGYSAPEFYDKDAFSDIQNRLFALEVTSIAYFTGQENERNSLIKRFSEIKETADIFSIGATLYFLLSGIHPKYSKTDFDIIDEKISYIVKKAMEINPTKRYQTIEELKQDLLRQEYLYDVALSFAGEDRSYAEIIANKLKNRGIKVFYDKFETANLWGKDLFQYLSHIYKDNAKYCVIFISDAYKQKMWTRHELRNAQNRSFLENKEYILPIFLENVELDGLNDTIGYVKASEFSESEIVDLIIEKVNKI